MKPLPDPASSQHPSEDEAAVLSEVDFELQIKQTQSALRGYIISISGQSSDVDDILQETNLFLWENRQVYKAGTNFKAWSFKIAYFKAMTNQRSRTRRGEVVFSQEITHRIAVEAESHFDKTNENLIALRRCLSGLQPNQIELIRVKYQQRSKLTDYARKTQQSIGAIQKTVSRIRLGLKDCIEKKLSNTSL